jgi:integrase
MRTPATARRLRLRIERLFDYAKSKGLREGENPARWRGNLRDLLAKQDNSRRHHAAMPYSDVPQFLVEVSGKTGYGALALQLLILTATRSGEVLGARWSEFDFRTATWTIPAARMKSRREHRVPLSAAALDVLRQLQEVQRGHFLFPSHDASKHASKSLMEHVLKGLRRTETCHGMRSSFRDWAGEQTAFPREVIEVCLAHLVGNNTERAYARGDLLDRRRAVMEAWAAFLSHTEANVVPLRRA